jgi:aminoglycoside phosphotransferase
VLQLRTPAARLYLKARPDWGAEETRLTSYLARLHPRAMPDLVAVEPDRAWMLMRAAPGPPLMEVRDPARWTDAAAALARIQIDCVERVDEIAALGCPERSLEWLAGEIEPLLGDTAAMQPENAEALTDEEVDRLRRLAPRLRAMCAELADHAVPPTIEHGDCWATNVIASEGGAVFIDWEDASLSMPFLSARLLLTSLSFTDALSHVADGRQRIAAAYLGAWREHGPLAGWSAARLERAFALAQALAPLHHAVQFRRFSIPVIETSWEVRAFCPEFLRALLRALDEERPPFT